MFYELLKQVVKIVYVRSIQISTCLPSFGMLVLLTATVATAQELRGGPSYPVHKFEFPVDDGAHLGQQIEWWYFTGQLFEDGEAQNVPKKAVGGFQLAFFRKRLADGIGGAPQHGYLAHAAYTDFETGSFTFAEQEAAGGLGIAGASEKLLRVWNGGWFAEEAGTSIILRFEIGAGGKKKRVRLILKNAEPWLQGDRGTSVKGICPSCYSFYYSKPRMQIGGSIESDDESRHVSGLGWMDHEFMNTILQPDDAGWDWMGLMIGPDTDVMVFRIRGKDGSVRFTGGSVRSNGNSLPLSPETVSVEPVVSWVSPLTSANYPIAWRVRIPSNRIDVTVRARVNNQELAFPSTSSSPTYWEGAVASDDGETLGYLEMTGYAKPFGDAAGGTR